MRADADFMVYVAARWPALVREAVLLGVRPDEAAEATTDALARCRRSWGRASQEEDVDALVRDELTRAAARRQRSDPAGREGRAQELLVLAPPTLDDLKHQEREARRAGLRRAARIAVPLVLVAAGAGAYAATRADEPKPPPEKPPADVIGNAAVAREENPAPGVVWYADGQLHLEHAVLAVEGLKDMTRMTPGVVYGDEEGRVVYAADDGTRVLLGHKDPDVPVAATEETGWAAWVEPDTQELVVVEAATGNVVRRTEVGDQPQVVAVDGDVIYLKGADGTRALLPTGVISERDVTPDNLLEVRSRIRVFQLDESTIDIVQSYFNVDYPVPGRGARVAPDGAVVGTRLPGGDGVIALYDADSGRALADGLSDDDSVLDFSLGAGRTAAYILAPDGLTPGRELQLRTCDLRTTFCRIAARIPNLGGTPVLAR